MAVPGGLRQRASVDKIRVDEVRVPVEIVVDRVVLIAFVLTAEAEIQRGDAGEILKSGVVGSISEGFDAQIGASANLAALLGVFGFENGVQVRALLDRDVFLRIVDVASHGADQGLQILSSTGAEKAALVAVGVEVSDGVLAQIRQMGLDPFVEPSRPGSSPSQAQ